MICSQITSQITASQRMTKLFCRMTSLSKQIIRDLVRSFSMTTHAPNTLVSVAVPWSHHLWTHLENIITSAIFPLTSHLSSRYSFLLTFVRSGCLEQWIRLKSGSFSIWRVKCKQQNIRVHTCMYINIYIYIFIQIQYISICLIQTVLSCR